MTSRRWFPTAVAALLGVAAALSAPGAHSAEGSPDSTLAAGYLDVASAPPWNPPRPVSRDEPWEYVLRLPGRIVAIPFALLGMVAPPGLQAVEQNNLVPRVAFVIAAMPRIGVIVLPGSQGDDTGTGLSARFEPPWLRRWFRAEHQASTLHYHRTLLTLLAGPARLGYTYEWRPTDGYFGLGAETEAHDGTQYAVQGEELRFSATVPVPWRGKLNVDRNRVMVWAATRTRTLTSGRGEYDPAQEVERGNRPSIETAYPEYAARLGVERANLIYGAELSLDGRSGRPHWSRGGRMKLGVERFDAPLEAVVLGQAREDGPQYVRYRAEVEGGVSFGRSPRTFRLLLRAVDTEVSRGSTEFDPFDYTRLGGSEGLAGFQPRRFHELDAFSGRLSYIFPLAQHAEVSVFAERGNVYRDLHSDARLASLKGSWGFELRPRTKFAPLGAFGFSKSVDGVRYTFSVGGVE